MRYLIDGYNLFFKIEHNILPLQKKRNLFLQTLDHELKGLNMHVTLIFDSDHQHAHPFASKQPLETLDVVFSPKHLSADHYILELLSWHSQNTTLITSDRELKTKATHLGAKTQSIEEFLHFLEKKLKKKGRDREDQKPLFQESTTHFHRLLKAFEKRLSEDENV